MSFKCVYRVCMTMGCCLKTHFVDAMQVTCSASSMFLHGPAAPGGWVLISPSGQMGSICSGHPASVLRPSTPCRQDEEVSLLSLYMLFSFSLFITYPLSSLMLHSYFLSSVQLTGRLFHSRGGFLYQSGLDVLVNLMGRP